MTETQHFRHFPTLRDAACHSRLSIVEALGGTTSTLPTGGVRGQAAMGHTPPFATLPPACPTAKSAAEISEGPMPNAGRNSTVGTGWGQGSPIFNSRTGFAQIGGGRGMGA